MRKGSDILFFAATHGDEGFTLPILKELEAEFSQRLHWLIANEMAFERGVKFVDADLNRSAPGDPNSTQYEMRRAHELLEMAKRYRFVIDLHGTTANSGVFVLVPNPTHYNIALAASLPIANVVIWAAKSSERLGPLTQFINCAVEIECGPKSSANVCDELREILRTILTDGLNPDPTKIQNWFRVSGKMPKEELATTEGLQDFKQTTLGGETFYPLLVGQYEDAICFKMERISFWDLLAY
ncbi:MAG: succinylglutamate desuccinylase/aspartoacylase family protein [Candidatus Portnoybacteria bacterium]|nr:succinylglutamate desuccinylase/aspartoacylase family protein [Candidatus Portnoybacteria bacterium]